MLRAILAFGLAIIACCAWFLFRGGNGNSAISVPEEDRGFTRSVDTPISEMARAAEDRNAVPGPGAENGALVIDSGGLRTWLRIQRGSDGGAVKVARLALCAPSYSHLSWTSDDDGFGSIDVQHLAAALSSIDGRDFGELWRLSIKIEGEGFGPRIVRLEPETRDTALPVSLEAEAVIRCMAKSPSGEPLVGATVRASVSGSAMEPSGTTGTTVQLERVISFELDPLLKRMRHVGGSGAQDWSVTTNETGLGEIRGLPAGAEVQLLIAVNGFVQEIELNPPALEVGETRRVDWTCPPTGAIRGVLTDTEGQPSSRFTVCLVRRDGASEESSFLLDQDAIVAEVAVKSDGSFLFPAVPLGSYYCGFLPSRHPPGLALARRVSVSATDPHPMLQLQLSTRGFLDGIIAGATQRDESFAIEAYLEGVDGYVTTRCDAADGYTFRMQPTPIGTYMVRGRGNMGSALESVSCSTGSHVVLSVVASK